MRLVHSLLHGLTFCLLAACSSPATEQSGTTATTDSANTTTKAPAEATATPTTAPTVASATPPPTPAVAAETVVADLYAAHNAQKSPFFQSESRSRIRQYFTNELAGLIWQDAKSTAKGELGLLDADPLYDAQDADVTDFTIQPAVVKGGQAEVQVSFSSLGAKKTFTYLLENEQGRWRIGDILYGDGSQLLQKLSGKVENELR